MGAQCTYGTAGATGGGWSAQPGTIQPAYGEFIHEPRWSWQCRAPKTIGDRNMFFSRWSFGCRANGGMPTGNDCCIIGRDISSPDPFEPFSAAWGGTQSLNFIKGIVKDSGGSPVGGVVVQGFVTATDAFVGQVNNLADGTYTLGTEQLKTTPHYLVAYKAGSPDTAGTTVNTLLPTNVDGT